MSCEISTITLSSGAALLALWSQTVSQKIHLVRRLHPHNLPSPLPQAENVLVVELGYLGDEECIWLPSNNARRGGPNACVRHRFNYTALPQPGLNNATTIYPIGAIVGGSSAVNGMVFDRGAKADYDAWESIGNPGWNWDSLFPYFRKSTTLTAPSRENVKKYGYTYDTAAYGEGPIQASYSLFQWESTSKCRTTFPFVCIFCSDRY